MHLNPYACSIHSLFCCGVLIVNQSLRDARPEASTAAPHRLFTILCFQCKDSTCACVSGAIASSTNPPNGVSNRLSYRPATCHESLAASSSVFRSERSVDDVVHSSDAVQWLRLSAIRQAAWYGRHRLLQQVAPRFRFLEPDTITLSHATGNRRRYGQFEPPLPFLAVLSPWLRNRWPFPNDGHIDPPQAHGTPGSGSLSELAAAVKVSGDKTSIAAKGFKDASLMLPSSRSGMV